MLVAIAPAEASQARGTMSSSFLIVASLNGLAYGMLLFLVSVGLTLIFGLMNFVNLAHGSLFMLGAYVALTTLQWLDSFPLAVLAAALTILVAGATIERVLLRPLYKRPHLDQVLLTLGLLYIASDIVRGLWGPAILSIPEPTALAGSMQFLDVVYPKYRMFVIGVGIALAVPLLWMERYSLYGAILRAAVADQEMATGLGINIRRVFSTVIGLGALLAGFAGALGGPIVGLYLGLDVQILITSLVVVVVGGLGSLLGTLCGSILVGMAYSFGTVLFPRFSSFLVFAVMAAVLLLRPQGLLGRKPV